MKKGKHIVILSILLFILISFAGMIEFTSYSKGADFTSFAKTFRDHLIINRPGDAIVLQIGNHKITREQFDETKISTSDKSDQATYEYIIKSTIRNMVAQDMGIGVGRDEVFKYIGTLKRSYVENPQAMSVLKQKFEELGLEESSFWTSNRTYKIYYDFLLVSKLRSHLRKEIHRANNLSTNYTNEEIHNLVDSELDRLINQKSNEIKIRYFD